MWLIFTLVESYHHDGVDSVITSLIVRSPRLSYLSPSVVTLGCTDNYSVISRINRRMVQFHY